MPAPPPAAHLAPKGGGWLSVGELVGRPAQSGGHLNRNNGHCPSLAPPQVCRPTAGCLGFPSSSSAPRRGREQLRPPGGPPGQGWRFVGSTTCPARRSCPSGGAGRGGRPSAPPPLTSPEQRLCWGGGVGVPPGRRPVLSPPPHPRPRSWGAAPSRPGSLSRKGWNWAPRVVPPQPQGASVRHPASPGLCAHSRVGAQAGVGQGAASQAPERDLEVTGWGVGGRARGQLVCVPSWGPCDRTHLPAWPQCTPALSGSLPSVKLPTGVPALRPAPGPPAAALTGHVVRLPRCRGNRERDGRAGGWRVAVLAGRPGSVPGCSFDCVPAGSPLAGACVSAVCIGGGGTRHGWRMGASGAGGCPGGC